MDWKWVLISFLIALLLGGARARVIPEHFSTYVPPKPYEAIASAPFKRLHQAPRIHVPKPVPVAPKPVYKAPTASAGVTGCGSDPYMAQIYMRESGCRTNAINPIGACGLGQALPCSKMGCSLSDWSCQDRFFRNYAVSVYGSPAAAWAAWQSKSWW